MLASASASACSGPLERADRDAGTSRFTQGCPARLALIEVARFVAAPLAARAALRAVAAARAGMARLDMARQAQGLPPLPFGAALHLGEMLWGNIGAADRLDFTAIGPTWSAGWRGCAGRSAGRS